jgi:hypothetical protein
MSFVSFLLYIQNMNSVAVDCVLLVWLVISLERDVERAVLSFDVAKSTL